MVDGIRQKVVRRLPGVGWREDRLAERTAEVAELRARLADAERSLAGAERSLAETGRRLDRTREKLRDVRQERDRASFRRELLNLRRALVALRAVDPDKRHPQRQLPFKLRNYRLAASHGIPVPGLLGSWGRAEEIDLSSLPDEFVLKSDGGAGGHGVLPLRRVGADRYELLDGTRQLAGAEVTGTLGSGPSLSGPFFAEEVLVQPDGGPIPDDVKIYVAYGRVQHVLLRRMPEHGNLGTARYRYLGADTEDLGEVAYGQRIDPAIAPPEGLTSMVEIAAHLSRAVGVPFIRVDLYATDRGVVLGEITRAPGGKQVYLAEHDEWLGRTWERARWELDLDLAAGRPAGILHGTHPAPNPYPPGHVSTRPDPGSWAVRTVPCEQWCHPRERA